MERRVVNPFTPSFGKMPLVFAGRESVVEDMDEAFAQGLGNPNLASVIVGARGTGKTALLACIAQRARDQGWVCASTSAMPGMLDDILERTFEASSGLVSVDEPRRVAGLELGQLFGIQWETLQRAPENWRTKMNRLLDKLAELDTGLLITVDEVHAGLDELKTLVSVYQHFVQEERNVALVMAGLPHKVSALLNDEDISFLRRARRIRLQRIPDYEVRAAFEETVEQGGKAIAPDALDCAVAEIAGFPYMMQLVGYWVWSSARRSEVIDATAARRGIVLAREQMREGVFESAYLDLSENDKCFLKAMLTCGDNVTLARVAEHMGVKSNYASTYKRRLLEFGVIGEYGSSQRFEIPGFREYFQEQVG